MRWAFPLVALAGTAVLLSGACSLIAGRNLQAGGAGGTGGAAGLGGMGASGAGVPGDGGGGNTTCPVDMGDCDGDGSCETNVRTSDAHCGACDYACGGEGCVDGSCLLDRILTSGATNIAVDAAHVYVNDLFGHQILRLPTDGSAEATVFALGGTLPSAIQLRSTDVYWVALDGFANGMGQLALYQRPKSDMSGDFVTPSWVDTGAPVGGAGPIGGNANLITLTRRLGSPDGALFAWGGMPPGIIPLGAEANVAGMHVLATSTQMVWTTHGDGGPASGAVHWRDLANAVTVESNLPRPEAIAERDGWAYWTNSGAQELPTPVADGSVMRKQWSAPASSAEVLATDQAEPLCIAVDASHAYWTCAALENSGAALRRRSIDGSAPLITLAEASAPNAHFFGVAATSDEIYFIVFIEGFTSEIYKRAKRSIVLSSLP